MQKKSLYEEFFDIIDEKTAKCKTCNDSKGIVARPKGGSTGCYRYHLKKEHRDVFDKLVVGQKEKSNKRALLLEIPGMPNKKSATQENGTIIEKFFNTWKPDDTRAKAVDKLFALLISKHSLPVSIVDSPLLKKALGILNPNYKLRSRNTFSNEVIPQVYGENVTAVRALLQNKKFSITLDSWSSKDGKHSLLVITAHLIDSVTMLPKYMILNVGCTGASHKAQDYYDIVLSSLAEKGLNLDQVLYVVRDGEPTMECLAGKLKRPSPHCFAHNIQLCIKDLLDNITGFDDTLEKLKLITRRLSKSPKVQASFIQHLLDAGLQRALLKKHCPVRWSSLYLMLESFIKAKSGVIGLLSEYRSLPSIEDEEWDNMVAMLEVLKPLHDVTKQIQTRHYAPVSIIIPTVRVLQEMYDEDSQRFSTIDILKRELSASMKTRFAKYIVSDDLQLATALDPRYRASTFLPINPKEMLIDAVHQLLLDKEQIREASPVSSAPPEEPSNNLFEQFTAKYGHRICQNPELPVSERRRIAEREVESYLSQKPNVNTDPFDFWSDERNKTLYPNLRLLAIDTLTAPATSSESERAFSAAGLIPTGRRNRIGDDMLQQLMILHLNSHLFA